MGSLPAKPTCMPGSCVPRVGCPIQLQSAALLPMYVYRPLLLLLHRRPPECSHKLTCATLLATCRCLAAIPAFPSHSPCCRPTERTRKLTYAAVMEHEWGHWAGVAVRFSIVVGSAGFLVLYLIVLADLLVGECVAGRVGLVGAVSVCTPVGAPEPSASHATFHGLVWLRAMADWAHSLHASGHASCRPTHYYCPLQCRERGL